MGILGGIAVPQLGVVRARSVIILVFALSGSMPHTEDRPTGSQTLQSQGLNPETPPFDPPQATGSFLVNGTNAILLQTAQAIASNLEQPEKRMQLHVLLDSGSQCSIITKGACKRLA